MWASLPGCLHRSQGLFLEAFWTPQLAWACGSASKKGGLDHVYIGVMYDACALCLHLCFWKLLASREGITGSDSPFSIYLPLFSWGLSCLRAVSSLSHVQPEARLTKGGKDWGWVDKSAQPGLHSWSCHTDHTEGSSTGHLMAGWCQCLWWKNSWALGFPTISLLSDHIV